MTAEKEARKRGIEQAKLQALQRKKCKTSRLGKEKDVDAMFEYLKEKELENKEKTLSWHEKIHDSLGTEELDRE